MSGTGRVGIQDHSTATHQQQFDDRPKRARDSNGGEIHMASVKQTREGNWYAVNEVTGDIIQGQPQGGFATRGGAKGWAVRNLEAVQSRSGVGTF